MSGLLTSFLRTNPAAEFLKAPFSVSQDAPQLRTSTDNTRSVVPANLVGATATVNVNGGWTREVAAAYDGGAGCYIGANGSGYMFKVLGTNFRLEGLMSVNGGGFSVAIDGVAAGTGTCNAATTTRGTYYQASGLSNTVHIVQVMKTGGTVLFLDTVSAV